MLGRQQNPQNILRKVIASLAWPQALLVLAALCFAGALYFGLQWREIQNLNKAYLNRSIVHWPLASLTPEAYYMRAYLLASTIKTAKDVDTVADAYLMAETSPNTLTRALAKFATGNLYFALARQSAKIAEGGAHQQAVAQIELAREAYKDALRLYPHFSQARFNLELLDRTSPDKRTQGWQGGTDGVSLQPFKKNGTAMMRDNTRRGLP